MTKTQIVVRGLTTVETAVMVRDALTTRWSAGKFAVEQPRKFVPEWNVTVEVGIHLSPTTFGWMQNFAEGYLFAVADRSGK